MTGQSSVPIAADPPIPPLAIRFANTRYGARASVREGLATPGQLAGWLRANAASLAEAGAPGAADAGVSSADLARFVALRDTIRSLVMAAIEGEPLDRSQVTTLNETAALAPAWPVLVAGPDGVAVAQRCDSSDGLPALGAIARDAVRLLGEPGRADVRACQAPGCVQFFVKDHSRRTWCSAACGNRARVARHYQRHKTG
jgi:predicted RNA-binding Zn ribbon-like protein